MKSIVIIASGPSLDLEQIDLIRQSGLDTMVINDNYKLLPTAKYLFAADMRWWYRHYDQVPAEIDCYTLAGHPEHLDKRLPGALSRLKGVDYTTEFGLYDDKVHHGGNSGYIGLQLARLLGYNRIILAGFDCQHTYGKRHWFGDHDSKYFTKNADDVKQWVEKFDLLAPLLYNDSIHVINCTIQTALTCFETASYIDALFEENQK